MHVSEPVILCAKYSNCWDYFLLDTLKFCPCRQLKKNYLNFLPNTRRMGPNLNENFSWFSAPPHLVGMLFPSSMYEQKNFELVTVILRIYSDSKNQSNVILFFKYVKKIVSWHQGIDFFTFKGVYIIQYIKV